MPVPRPSTMSWPDMPPCPICGYGAVIEVRAGFYRPRCQDAGCPSTQLNVCVEYVDTIEDALQRWNSSVWEELRDLRDHHARSQA